MLPEVIAEGIGKTDLIGRDRGRLYPGAKSYVALVRLCQIGSLKYAKGTVVMLHGIIE